MKHGIRTIAVASSLVLGSVAASPCEVSAETTQEPAHKTDVGSVTPDGPLSAILMQSDPTGMSAQVAALGVDGWERLFAVLRDGRFPVKVGTEGHSFRKLDAPRRAALIAATARLPYEFVLARLDELPTAGVGERLVAFEILGAVAGSEDLGLCMRMAEPKRGETRVDRRLRDGFGQALAALLERHPYVSGVLVAQFRDLHPSLISSSVSALGSAPFGGQLVALSNLLGRVPEADVLILIELGRAAASARHPVDERVFTALRPYLTTSNSQLCVEAVVAAEKLQDRRAVPFLIDLLESEHRSVLERAYAALGSTSRKQIPPVAQTWRTWHEEAIAWWADERLLTESKLHSGTPAEVARLVMELSKRHMFRHELTPLLAPVLEREEAELVALACAALGHLGSDRAIEPLLELLDSSRDDELRGAAWRALKRVTGQELGPDPEEWRAVYAG